MGTGTTACKSWRQGKPPMEGKGGPLVGRSTCESKYGVHKTSKRRMGQVVVFLGLEAMQTERHDAWDHDRALQNVTGVV